MQWDKDLSQPCRRKIEAKCQQLRIRQSSTVGKQLLTFSFTFAGCRSRSVWLLVKGIPGWSFLSSSDSCLTSAFKCNYVVRNAILSWIINMLYRVIVSSYKKNAKGDQVDSLCWISIPAVGKVHRRTKMLFLNPFAECIYNTLCLFGAGNVEFWFGNILFNIRWRGLRCKIKNFFQKPIQVI